jgi:uncharacterized coiled-coil protein SlyX
MMTDETRNHEAETAALDNGDRTGEAGRPEDADLMARMSQLESDIAARDSELAVLKDALAGAVARYRAAVAASAAGVPEELLRGETVEEIDSSLEQARRIVSKVREQLERDAAAKSVPAGAPPRTPPDMSALSPTEKIVHALTTERR